MKLRYRVNHNSLFIPQYQTPEAEWKDVQVKNVYGELERIAELLANPSPWHFNVKDPKDREHASVVFKSELKVAAFLGALKIFCSDRTKKLDL